MESWTCGPHLLELEPPDVFHCHVRGAVEEQHARETVRIASEELGAKRGVRIFFVVHLESSGAEGTFTPAARKYLGTARLDWKAIVLVGGTLLMRMAVTVLGRAQAILSPQKVPTVMVKSMDEARKYIAEVRAKEAAHAGPASAGSSS